MYFDIYIYTHMDTCIYLHYAYTIYICQTLIFLHKYTTTHIIGNISFLQKQCNLSLLYINAHFAITANIHTYTQSRQSLFVYVCVSFLCVHASIEQMSHINFLECNCPITYNTTLCCACVIALRIQDLCSLSLSLSHSMRHSLTHSRVTRLAQCVHACISHTQTNISQSGSMAEWLRRQIRNLVG